MDDQFIIHQIRVECAGLCCGWKIKSTIDYNFTWRQNTRSKLYSFFSSVKPFRFIQCSRGLLSIDHVSNYNVLSRMPKFHLTIRVALSPTKRPLMMIFVYILWQRVRWSIRISSHSMCMDNRFFWLCRVNVIKSIFWATFISNYLFSIKIVFDHAFLHTASSSRLFLAFVRSVFFIGFIRGWYFCVLFHWFFFCFYFMPHSSHCALPPK